MTPKIVGYLYRGEPTDTQLVQLTHLAHSFAVPTNGTGGLSVNRPDVLAAVVPRARAAGCKMGISIFGGLGIDSPAHRNAKNAVINHRSALVDSIMAIVDRYGLDWVDLDLEPIGEASDAFVLLLRDLRSRLGSRELSAAVLAGYPWAGFKPAGFPVVDFLVIMTYDDEWPAGTPHASWEFAQHYIDMWTAAGLPNDKTVAGVPLYGRPGADMTYRRILAAGGSPDADSAKIGNDVVGYNGRPTVRRKMQQWGGVAFWEVFGDTLDDTSLIGAAHGTTLTIPAVPAWWRGWFPN